MRHFDRANTSASLLGLDARRSLLAQEVTGAATLAALLALLAREIDPDDRLTLITNMRSGGGPADVDLLSFFYAGLNGKPGR